MAFKLFLLLSIALVLLLELRELMALPSCCLFVIIKTGFVFTCQSFLVLKFSLVLASFLSQPYIFLLKHFKPQSGFS
jgi:hypothetical protein